MAFSRITNTNISGMQWLQADLLIKRRGMGIRQVHLLALSAFLASAVVARWPSVSVLDQRPRGRGFESRWLQAVA